MSDNSAIEWTDATWNPVVGCSRVSAGCDHCYAVGMTRRLEGMSKAVGLGGEGKAKYRGLTIELPQAALDRGVGVNGRHFNGEVRCVEEALEIPLRWKKPARIFVNSMSDLFHPKVPFEFIDHVFAVMALCPQHTFQVLTKRPERMRDYLCQLMPDKAGRRWYEAVRGEFRYKGSTGQIGPEDTIGTRTSPALPNVWLGVSIEDQATADERIPLLLQTPAAVRWVSAEPLLRPVSLEMMPSPYDRHNGWPGTYHSLNGSWWPAVGDYEEECRHRQEDLVKIDWVVVGGESGPNARPMHPDWARSLRDQCAAAGVPFFMKQLHDGGGKLIKNISMFPADLQIREYPYAIR